MTLKIANCQHFHTEWYSITMDECVYEWAIEYISLFNVHAWIITDNDEYSCSLACAWVALVIQSQSRDEIWNTRTDNESERERVEKEGKKYALMMSK